MLVTVASEKDIFFCCIEKDMIEHDVDTTITVVILNIQMLVNIVLYKYLNIN
jgi:hypothetical protein